jgi:hypothetical protein
MQRKKHRTPQIPPTGLDRMDKKIRTKTTRKMGKLDYNHERIQTKSQNEHKHQNDDQKPTGRR